MWHIVIRSEHGTVRLESQRKGAWLGVVNSALTKLSSAHLAELGLTDNNGQGNPVRVECKGWQVDQDGDPIGKRRDAQLNLHVEYVAVASPVS